MTDIPCPAVDGLRCPVADCPGRRDPGACRRLALRMALPPPGGGPAVDPAVRDAVNACPSRGPVLPISLQDDCGCGGKELSECRAGRGAIAGRVTLRDCISCQSR